MALHLTDDLLPLVMWNLLSRRNIDRQKVIMKRAARKFQLLYIFYYLGVEAVPVASWETRKLSSLINLKVPLLISI